MTSKKKGATDAKPAALHEPKRKRVRVAAGQLVAVPLIDGTYGLLHVVIFNISIIAAHFAHRSATPDGLLDGIDEALKKGPIAMLEVTSDEIRVGDWPVIGQREPTYPPSMLDMKGESYTAGMSRFLLSAYHGLRPWDEMFNPRYYERALLPGVPVPPTVRYKRDFAEDAARAAAASPTVPAGDTEAPVTDGAAEIHIEIKYPGDALPSIELLHRRQALEQSLEEAGAGEVTDAGGGGGVMDVYLQTSDVRRAMPLVEAAVKAAGFEKDATIETTALSDAEDDE